MAVVVVMSMFVRMSGIVIVVLMTVLVSMNVELHSFDARLVFARSVDVVLVQAQLRQFAF